MLNGYSVNVWIENSSLKVITKMKKGSSIMPLDLIFCDLLQWHSDIFMRDFSVQSLCGASVSSLQSPHHVFYRNWNASEVLLVWQRGTVRWIASVWMSLYMRFSVISCPGWLGQCSVMKETFPHCVLVQASVSFTSIWLTRPVISSSCYFLLAPQVVSSSLCLDSSYLSNRCCDVCPRSFRLCQ